MSPGAKDTPNPSDRPDPSGDSVEQLRSELEADRQRIAALEAENAALLSGSTGTAGGAGGSGTPPRRRSHRFWIAILLVIGCVLTPLSIIALFVKNEINDTDRYIQTIKPLSSNAAVQAYVAEEVSDQLFQRVDIKQYVEDALPRRAEALAGPLTSALQGFVRQATERILQTDQFQTLWIDANRLAHTQLVNVLTGSEDGEIAATENGEVTIDLSKVTQQLQTRLESTGIDVFSDIPLESIGGKITVFQSDDLYKARGALGVLNTVAFILPFVVLACFGGAIYLSGNRRRGFVASAIALAIGALILGLVLWVGRGAYLNAATGRQFPYDAAAAIYDTLVRFLQTTVRSLLFLSVIVIIAVFFAGPSRFALWFRTRMRQGANWLGHQSDEAGWDWLSPNAFVVHRKNGMRIVVAVLAFIVLFRWEQPTPSVVFYVALVTLLLLGLIEFFGREPLPDHPPDGPAGPPGVPAGPTPAPLASS